MQRVGFVYLDELQHIHHFLSPAVALAKMPGVAVDIFTYQDEHKYLRELLNLLEASDINIVELSTYAYRKVLEKWRKRKQPSALYIFKKHKKKFLAYDALVFTDHTAGVVKEARGKQPLPKLVFIDHGAGDGAYGYKDSHAMFDMVIVAGEKKAERLKKELPQHTFKLHIGGYAKFDLVRAEQPQFNPFGNDKPVVLYCPHFSRELSSWYKMGLDVLEFFYNQEQFNLIFAPHYNLFNKKGFEDPGSIPQKYHSANHIFIDTGSRRSVNMTYTLNSDIYLGDVSSQVYEFMFRPRPLIFINAHRINWQADENYLMWRAGKVVSSIAAMEEALATTASWPQKLLSEEEKLFRYTFYKPAEAAGPRIARLLMDEINS